MATQTPMPEDGDRPDGPMPEAPDEQTPAQEPAKPARPVVDHPEEQNSG